jgi:Zn-dependent protease
MLLHEWGHLAAARRRRHAVYAIELYPIHGLTRCEAARSAGDASVIAWGGVLAQLAVGVPLIVATSLLGFTSYGPLNAPLVMFGYFSVAVALFNLLPVPRLDGATAWRIVPQLWRRWRSRRPRPAPPAPASLREKVGRGTVHKGPWAH